MTFRMRLTVLVSVAVAIALAGASLVVYYSYRHDAMRQVDGELASSLSTGSLSIPIQWAAVGRAESFPIVLNDAPVIVNARIARAPLSKPYQRLIGQRRLRTVSVNGEQARQLRQFGANDIVTVTRSLTDVNRTLSHLRWLLLLTCLGGIAAAALLGALVSTRAIAPLRRLTEATERAAETGELNVRTGQRGRDEISRLSAQLDALFASLERSLQTQRQLVADASHELRTPLATLRANVGLLARPGELTPEDRAELVADVEAELRSMTDLVSELVELAHGEELDVEPTEFRLDDLVRSAVGRAARRTPAVAFELDAEPTIVRGVPERIERAVDNLLDNARKWSPAGTTVDVSVRDGVVEVRDRGPGVAAEDAPLVFNRFYRSARARGLPGAGLGLAIVKQVADAHNGTVSVADAPGGGAVLRLALLPTR